jgi:hypothetical protein
MRKMLFMVRLSADLFGRYQESQRDFDTSWVIFKLAKAGFFLKRTMPGLPGRAWF